MWVLLKMQLCHCHSIPCIINHCLIKQILTCKQNSREIFPNTFLGIVPDFLGKTVYEPNFAHFFCDFHFDILVHVLVISNSLTCKLTNPREIFSSPHQWPTFELSEDLYFVEATSPKSSEQNQFCSDFFPFFSKRKC